MFVLLGRCNHGARGVREGALGVFKLDSSVIDVESAKQVVHPVQDGIAFRSRHVFDQHVTTQRICARSEAPDMDIVNVDHADDLPHRAGHFRQFQPARKAFQQHIQRFLDDIPGTPNDQYPNQDRQIGSMISSPEKWMATAPIMIATELTASPSICMKAARMLRSWSLSRCRPHIMEPFNTKPAAATPNMVHSATCWGCRKRCQAS